MSAYETSEPMRLHLGQTRYFATKVFTLLVQA